MVLQNTQNISPKEKKILQSNYGMNTAFLFYENKAFCNTPIMNTVILFYTGDAFCNTPIMKCPYTHRHWALVAWQASSAVSPWVGYAPTTLGPNLYIQNIGLLALRRCILIKFFNFQIESIIMNH